MQFSTITVAIFAGLVAASPLVEKRAICSGINTPVCCSASVDGVANLECSAGSSSAEDGASLIESCATTGQEAYCCTLLIAGLGVLCNAVTA